MEFDCQNMNQEMQSLKMKYIPMCADGKISTAECASLVGITARSVRRLKSAYKEVGASIFINGNTGKSVNRKFDYEKIVSDYMEFDGTPFAAFLDDCIDYLHYEKVPSYSSLSNILKGAGIVSPRARPQNPEKVRHLPRRERPNSGDLIQIDASPFDWLMNGRKISLHGAIDDATHSVTALYFCENECLLGYYQVLAQTAVRMGGLPKAIYSDRSACFFVSRGTTLEEQLLGAEKSETQWQKTCRELEIELIAAYSPQAKGRIERLWQTLQGRLPFIFRYLKIDTIEKANEFLSEFIDGFNRRFTVPPENPEPHWKSAPHDTDFDFLFSVRAEKKTRSDGTFVYHGYKFALESSRTSCVRFTLCLSESYGIRAFIGGKYYGVKLCDAIGDCIGDTMTQVEKNLIYRYFYTDTHSRRATIRAG